jgi:hypothetical protein
MNNYYKTSRGTLRTEACHIDKNKSVFQKRKLF